MKTSFVMKFCKRVYAERHLRLNENKLGHCAKMKMPINDTDRHKEVIGILESGNFPDECFMCANAEQEGIRSWRDQGNVFHNDKKIFKVEITLDNTCNLACAYCYGNLSSVWEAEAKRAPEKYKHFHSLSAKPDNATLQESLDYIYSVIREAAAVAKDVDRVEVILLGGEPFYNAFFKNSELTPLIDEYFRLTTDPYTNFLLNIFSNCNAPKNMIDKYIDEINAIKQKYSETSLYFMLSISNESIEKTSEAIRFGSNWNNFKYNLDRFFNSSIDRMQFHLTINSLSITKLTDYLKYINEIAKTYPRKTIAVQLSQIYEPKAFSISVLDQSFAKYIHEAKAFVDTTDLYLEGLTFEDLSSSIGKNTDKKYQLQEYINYHKEVRKVDLAQIEPEICFYVNN